MIDVGDKAPKFSLQASGGRTVQDTDYQGQPYLLYFYPKADTPGCTTQACDLQSDLPQLQRLGLQVIGVSPDPVPKLDKFAEKFGLTFPLASDADHALSKIYDVWVEKKNYGKTYLGIQRSSFLIDRDGKIRCVWRNVKAAEHARLVKEAAAEL
ncbi:Thioredoxin peroxidase [Acetobacteraceae bacterium EV16G]|uniref:thioredoxin-dependent peroxiredoxin n=1 Tax=Sorlinia euscelidii TaxID=3081148 RepID=A0ABU7U1B3_9PROT